MGDVLESRQISFEVKDMGRKSKLEIMRAEMAAQVEQAKQRCDERKLKLREIVESRHENLDRELVAALENEHTRFTLEISKILDHPVGPAGESSTPRFDWREMSVPLVLEKPSPEKLDVKPKPRKRVNVTAASMTSLTGEVPEAIEKPQDKLNVWPHGR